MMSKLSAVGRLLAVVVAIASAFVQNPIIAPLLLIFGGIAAIGNTPERNAKNYMITVVLILGASALQGFPYVGTAHRARLDEQGRRIARADAEEGVKARVF